MRKKSWFIYVIIIILFCILIFIKEYAIRFLALASKSTFGANNLLLITVSFIFNVVIGLNLGIEYFLEERKKVGTWEINLCKLILMGFPSLFFSLTLYLERINSQFVHNKLLQFASYGINFIPVFQIIFGYVLITSLYKKQTIKFE